jgi:hypothetical protein
MLHSSESSSTDATHRESQIEAMVMIEKIERRYVCFNDLTDEDKAIRLQLDGFFNRKRIIREMVQGDKRDANVMLGQQRELFPK